MSSDNNKLIQAQLSNIERNFRNLQSEYDWKPMSETIQQFRAKFPLQFDDKASLIYSAKRLNYVKSSQPKLAQEVRKSLKQYGTYNQNPHVAELPDPFRFGQLCNKLVDRPKDIIYTNATGFARLVDPYLSTTMKDITPQVKPQHDTVTFWNWTEREERKRIPKGGTSLQSRMVVPVFKHKLHNSFCSEMQANFVNPVQLEFHLDPRTIRPIVLDPTDRAETDTESSMYGDTKNCSRILKQRKYE